MALSTADLATEASRVAASAIDLGGADMFCNEGMKELERLV